VAAIVYHSVKSSNKLHNPNMAGNLQIEESRYNYGVENQLSAHITRNTPNRLTITLRPIKM